MAAALPRFLHTKAMLPLAGLGVRVNGVGAGPAREKARVPAPLMLSQRGTTFLPAPRMERERQDGSPAPLLLTLGLLAFVPGIVEEKPPLGCGNIWRHGLTPHPRTANPEKWARGLQALLPARDPPGGS